MLLYVQSKAFPLRTFPVVVSERDKVARVRAQLLHFLYNLGKEDHQFRLRYNGQFLRDAYNIQDYDIPDNALIKMVPLSKRQDSMSDLRSVNSSIDSDPSQSQGQMLDVRSALEREINFFDRQEKLLLDFKSLLYIHAICAVLSVFIVYWYSVAWLAVALLLAAIFVPTYTRLGGFVGNNTHLRFWYCGIVGVFTLIFMAVDLYFASVQWIKVVNHGCPNWIFEGDCAPQIVFTGVLCCFHALLLLITSVYSWLLFGHFKVEVGDFIEAFLVQERDIEKVILSAKQGRLKEKRQAAYELAVMAASSDDNKFLIVAEGGLDVLIALSLSRDEATQEHAVEALGELLTIPSIQDNFVEMGGMRTLTAVLHSPSARVMQEAAVAIYTVVSESEENMGAVIADHGVEDLSHAAYQGTLYCQRTVASIFLELAFNADIRQQLTARNLPAQTLTHLVQSSDVETQRFALQALELLAIQSSDMICAQEELLEILLGLPLKTGDERVDLLVGKILLYYAENRQTCSQMLRNCNLKDSLAQMVRSRDPILQKVVVKIIACMLETREFKRQAQNLHLDTVLEYVRSHSADKDSWDMADQVLSIMTSQDDLASLPVLSTLEKISKMEPKANFGSRTSLRSADIRGGETSSTSSSSDLRKTIS